MEPIFVLRYRSVDGCTKRASFKTAKKAREFIVHWIGADAIMGSGYAVSGDGIGVVQFLKVPEGTTFSELMRAE